MSIIVLILILALIGFAVWAEERYIPMAPGFKMFIRVVVIICVILWLLTVFGLLGPITAIKI